MDATRPHERLCSPYAASASRTRRGARGGPLHSSAGERHASLTARRTMPGLAVAMATTAAVAAMAPAAWATFPGLNGKLAYESRGGAGSSLFAIQPLAGSLDDAMPLTSGVPADRDAAWSADGHRIALTSQRDGNPEIYVMNADGSEQTRLTAHGAIDADPTLSPDGKRVAFNSTRDGNPEIYVMNVDGSAQTRLTFDPAVDQQADWSDGTIAFESTRDGNSEIYAMGVDGSAQTRLTFNPEVDANASWHPNGASIAYISGPVGARDIFTLRPGTAGRTRLTRNSGDHRFPAWSPDGKQIAFSNHFGSTLVMKAGGDSARRAAIGIDAAWGPLRAPPPQVPQLSRTVNVFPISGKVFVRVPGAAAAARLFISQEIPVGSIIDTRRGSAKVKAATADVRSTNSVIVSEGRAKLSQARGGQRAIVLRLPRLRCPSNGGARPDRLRAQTPERRATLSARSGSRKPKKPKKHNVRVYGAYSIGAPRGTDWTTINTCGKAGTITKVRRGRVRVFDLVTRSAVTVREPGRRRRVRVRGGSAVVGQYSTGQSVGG